MKQSAKIIKLYKIDICLNSNNVELPTENNNKRIRKHSEMGEKQQKLTFCGKFSYEKGEGKGEEKWNERENDRE